MEISICPYSLGWNFEGQRIGSRARYNKSYQLVYNKPLERNWATLINVIKISGYIPVISVISGIFELTMSLSVSSETSRLDCAFIVIRGVATICQLGILFLPIDIIITIANAIITKKYNNKHRGGGNDTPKYTPPKARYTPREYTYTPRYDSSSNFSGTGYTPRYTHNTYYTPLAASAPSELTKFKEDALSLEALPNPRELDQIKDRNDEIKLLFEMLKKIKEGRPAKEVWDLKDRFTKKDVTVRYRDLAKQFHPDKWASTKLSDAATEHINLIASYLSVSKELLEQSACP